MPSCQKRTSTGRKCDGYQTAPANSPAPDIAISRLSPLAAFDSQDELRAFHFFQARTSPQLAGFNDCEFWNRIILEAAQANLAVRHAVVALASAHEAFEQTGAVHHNANAFAFQQYGLAIEQHRARLIGSEEDVGAYLASCIVFMCIEMLQFHYISAMSLLQQAPLAWPLEVIDALLCRVQRQAIDLVGPAAFSVTVPPRIQAATAAPIPAQFASIAEAKHCLEFYQSCHSLIRPTNELSDLHDQTIAIFRGYGGLISDGSRAFDQLQVSLSENVHERDGQALAVLNIRQLLLHMSLEVVDKCSTPAEAEDRCDADYGNVFADDVDLAESVVQESLPASPLHLGHGNPSAAVRGNSYLPPSCGSEASDTIAAHISLP